MDKNEKATEANVPKIATEETVKTSPTVTEEDLEAKNVALEEEKRRLLEERENYKRAYLKERRKKGEEIIDEEDVLNDEDKLRKIAREEMSNSRLAEIAREQDLIIKKALRENKELKLVNLNKNTPPASVGTHSESTSVTSTLITPEQMAEFKRRGWDEKDIERYKKNLQKVGGR